MKHYLKKNYDKKIIHRLLAYITPPQDKKTGTKKFNGKKPYTLFDDTEKYKLVDYLEIRLSYEELLL